MTVGRESVYHTTTAGTVAQSATALARAAGLKRSAPTKVPAHTPAAAAALHMYIADLTLGGQMLLLLIQMLWAFEFFCILILSSVGRKASVLHSHRRVSLYFFSVTCTH